MHLEDSIIGSQSKERDDTEMVSVSAPGKSGFHPKVGKPGSSGMASAKQPGAWVRVQGLAPDQFSCQPFLSQLLQLTYFKHMLEANLGTNR